MKPVILILWFRGSHPQGGWRVFLFQPGLQPTAKMTSSGTMLSVKRMAPIVSVSVWVITIMLRANIMCTFTMCRMMVAWLVWVALKRLFPLRNQKSKVKSAFRIATAKPAILILWFQILYLQAVSRQFTCQLGQRLMAKMMSNGTQRIVRLMVLIVSMYMRVTITTFRASIMCISTICKMMAS